MNFYNKELLTNFLVVLIGIFLTLFPILIIKDITVPLSVISISIGCSLIATGISVFLSFLYRERNTKFYKYLSEMGLSDILVDRNMEEYSIKAINNAQRKVFYAQLGAPIFILRNKELFKELINLKVSIRILVNPEQFLHNNSFSTFTDHNELKLQECYLFAKEVGLEIREIEYPLTRTLIIDDEVMLVNNRISNHPITCFIYRKNKHDMSFYKYQLDLFEDIWNKATVIQ